jgi:hypothetical protein
MVRIGFGSVSFMVWSCMGIVRSSSGMTTVTAMTLMMSRSNNFLNIFYSFRSR